MCEKSGESGDSGRADDPENANCDRILGTTTVAQGGRISLVEDVREAFADRGIEVEEGDLIVYRLRDGRVVVEPA